MSELEEPGQGSKRGTHLLAILVLCYAVSFLGAEGAVRGLGDWYTVLAKPSWAPPMALFVPLWTVLYGVIAVGAWQVWEAQTRRSAAIWILVLQGLLGAAWSWIFFAYHNLLWASIEGAAVWAVTGLSVWAFSRVKASAALLMIPYWIWSAFMAALSFAVYRGNH